jgi:hypothetical protein
MMPTPRGKRIGPLSVPVEEEVWTPQTPPQILSFSNAIFWLYWEMVGGLVPLSDIHRVDSVIPDVRVTMKLMVNRERPTAVLPTLWGS